MAHLALSYPWHGSGIGTNEMALQREWYFMSILKLLAKIDKEHDSNSNHSVYEDLFANERAD